MKFFLFILLVSISATASAQVSRDVIHKVTVNNSKVAAEGFASKVVKGKLDNKGYVALREQIGILEKGQKLKATQSNFVPGSLKIYNGGLYENSWVVSLAKVSGGVLNNAPDLFTVLVRCKVERQRQSIKGGPYFTWYPDCKVVSVIPEVPSDF